MNIVTRRHRRIPCNQFLMAQYTERSSDLFKRHEKRNYRNFHSPFAASCSSLAVAHAANCSGSHNSKSDIGNHSSSFQIILSQSKTYQLYVQVLGSLSHFLAFSKFTAVRRTHLDVASFSNMENNYGTEPCSLLTHVASLVVSFWFAQDRSFPQGELKLTGVILD